MKPIQKKINILGVPSSAGAYGPGQEKAPDALRRAGLINELELNDIQVVDAGNSIGYRWNVDLINKKAMNVDQVADVVKHASRAVFDLVSDESLTVVFGGDCTVGIGTVDGVLKKTKNIGLIYIDLDTDLNTPESTDDGALDWMGVAHMLGLPDCEPKISQVGCRYPLLKPDQLFYFSYGNCKPFEKSIIKKFNIKGITLEEVKKDPNLAAQRVVSDWADQFEYVLIHLDLDVLDFLDIQLAENYRRNIGLKLEELMNALSVFIKLPHLIAMPITELNPDHGKLNGSTLTSFIRKISATLA